MKYSREDLAKIFAHYEAEEIRGATPRYIEDVHAGDKLPTMVKGPMTVTGFIAFAQGWGGLYIRANKLAWKQLQKHPGLGIPNKFGIPDVPERVHWEDDLATLVGTPAAYDYGPERCSWMSHHLTNWMGDAGFLRNLEVKIRRHNPVGDTLYINGEVTRTFTEGGAHYAEVAQRAIIRTANFRCWQPASFVCQPASKSSICEGATFRSFNLRRELSRKGARLK